MFISVQSLADSENSSLPAHESAALSGLLRSAISYHPIVDAGKARLRSAEQSVKTARWQYFPTPGVSYQRVFADVSDRSFQGDDYSTIISLEQPLWTGGRIKSGMARARANVGVSASSLEEDQRELALRVVQVYGQWLSASLQRQNLQTSEVRHESLFNRVERRLQGGVSTGSDLELAKGRLQSVKAELASTAANEMSAVISLSELTGVDLTRSRLETARREFPGLLSMIEAELIQSALANSPSIERADAEVDLARAAVKSRRSQTRPDIFLRFERQFNSVQLDSQGADSRVLVGVRSEFGAGLSTFSGIAEARESVTAALAFRRSAELSIREQVRADLTLLRSFEIRLSALREANRTAEQVYDSYQRQFLTGRKNWLDVMNSARDLQQARQRLADVTAGRLTLAWRLHVLSNSVAAISG